jgi:hypothetical protein
MSIQLSLIKVSSKRYFIYLENGNFLSLGMLGAFKVSFRLPSYFFLYRHSLELFLAISLLYVPFYNLDSGNDYYFYSRRLKKNFLAMVKERFVFFHNRISQLISASTDGFRKELRLIGVGYRFSVHLNMIAFKIGYSHLILYLVPYLFSVQKKGKNILLFFGTLGMFVSYISFLIKGFKIPNVYTGKGIRFKKEKLFIKQGKTKQI